MAVTNVRSAKAFDPVLIFRFIARWAPLGGKMTPAAHVNKVCGHSRSAGVAVWREGSNFWKLLASEVRKQFRKARIWHVLALNDCFSLGI